MGDGSDDLVALDRGELGRLVSQQLGEAEHGGEGSAQLVRDGGHELVLGGGVDPYLHQPPLRFESLPLCRHGDGANQREGTPDDEDPERAESGADRRGGGG